MLKTLEVRNFAVISELKLALAPGLNVFTGQTGAGKSILIEALGFLLGARGSVDWLRSGAPKLEVTGRFSAARLPKALKALHHVEKDEFTLRRELDSSGRSRASIDGKPLTNAALSAIGEALLDFHGQHEHQSLMKTSQQLELLDAFGGLAPLREKISAAYAGWTELQEKRKSMELSEEERLRRVDLYRFQVKEIDAARLSVDEEAEIEAVLPRLKNSGKIADLSAQAYALLSDEEGSVDEKLNKVERLIDSLVQLDPSLGEDQASLKDARAKLSELSAKLSDFQNAETGGGSLDELLSRLDLINKLKKKYGATVADVLAFHDKAKSELAWLEDASAKTAELEKEEAKLKKALDRLCSEAHDARMAAASKLSAKVNAELKGLGLASAKFSISVELEEGFVGPTGSDHVEFLIAPNPGEPLKPLKSIASGGELSRVMLAVKSIIAKNDLVDILVFDEVDAGVGGEVGRAVGRRLAELGRTHQVLCVTHLPQVACFASSHFHVSKEVAQGRSFVKVEDLQGDKRIHAIAVMLGGHELTTASKKHAQELLEASR